MYLNCHTYYSLKYGTLAPKELVEKAKKRKIDQLVLTDINNTSCSFEFVELCEQADIRPILGVEFRKNHRLLYIGIAKNAEGFKQLNEFLTLHSLENKTLPTLAPDFSDAYFIYAETPKPLATFRHNEFLGIRPEQVHSLYSSKVTDFPDRLVVLSPVTIPNKDDFKTHLMLRAIDLNILYSKLQQSNCCRQTEYFHSPKALKAHYALYSFIVENTEKLLATCSISFTKGPKVNLKAFKDTPEEDRRYLEELSLKGCQERYGKHHKVAYERLQKELTIINELNFQPYFLITWDIIKYAQQLGHHYVGRGSGANSIVAYCLRITDVDPLELDLYFERFINPHRSSPPDFDIDFSWDQRDEVIQYVFDKYGESYTALLATYNTFKYKSIVRELGKVFGLPMEEMDIIVSEPENHDRHHDLIKVILQYGKRIEGFPNYLSIHTGGILISQETLYYHTALQLMPKGFPIVHFDMYGAEKRDFHKFDILSQRGLGHLKDAVELIALNRGKSVDIHDVECIKNDQTVKEQLRSGHCIGCFYIESPAMRGLLHKLQCDDYISLVAASSIIRPGVSKSGMMREYISRFHNPESFEYLHPIFEKHLGETFGVMVYQEDVMKIVHHFAGLEMDESDVLRRIMSGKKHRSDTFERLQKKYFRNCKARGYPQQLTDKVWRQVESFSGYSFCKAHSASFAVESFQSLYLKTYFPLEFMVAVINNFGGFYKTEFYFHEARMHGGIIHPPSVNQSNHLTTIKGRDIYIGFVHIQGIEFPIGRRIVEERRKNGQFIDLEDFVNRVKIKADQLERLIRIGAFRFTNKNKYELMWEKNAVFNAKQRFESTPTLFKGQAGTFKLPNLIVGPFDQAFDEIELLGFPLRSPFDLLQDQNFSTLTSSDLTGLMGKQITITGYHVTTKNVRTVNGKPMRFGTWLGINGHFFDTTHFPPSLKRSPFRGKGIYAIKGTVVEDFGFPSIEVDLMERLPYVSDKRS